MDLGFATCGNATLIIYDRGIPVLVTDPWIAEPQYFGSWRLPYEFTPEQTEAFASARHVWLSHGHPDHLNLPSLGHFRDRTLLVPQHYGGRISTDLRNAGYRVLDLANGSWLQLSERVRILSMADWNQDAAVLIAVGNECAVLNLNDGAAFGTGAALKAQLRRFKRRFVLRLINYGDADMINYFTESGERIEPFSGARLALGREYSGLLKAWGGTHTAPFSCHHSYARTDSRWAAEYETPLEDHRVGFDGRRGQLIPGYFRYDVTTDQITETPMRRVTRRYHEPQEFGDDWTETLDQADIATLRAYFLKFDHLRRSFDFINCRVGGRDNLVALGGPKGRGVTFEAPRASLMTAIRYEVFDDLLIGNFMKTTLHGGARSLYPDFTPYVAKYGDNGRAFTTAEVLDYFRAYRQASGFQGWVDQVRMASARRLRSLLAVNPALYGTARRLYKQFRS